MIPLRLVIDTNLVVSLALKPDGLQRTVLLLAMTKPARWYASDLFCLSIGMCCRAPNCVLDEALVSR